MATHFKTIRSRSDFALNFWRYKTYNTEILTAFVETPNFDVSRWQRDLWDEIGERDRARKWEGVEKKVLMLQQRERSPSRRPPRNTSPEGGQRAFRRDGKTENEQKPKPKAKDHRCMYCGASDKHEARDCDAKKGKWCVRHPKNNMFCPPIESLRICWAFNGSAGCTTNTTCKFAHVCSLCGAGEGGKGGAAHSAQRCPSC